MIPHFGSGTGEHAKEKTFIDLSQDYHQSFLALGRVIHKQNDPHSDPAQIAELQEEHEKRLHECEENLRNFQEAWDKAFKHASSKEEFEDLFNSTPPNKVGSLHSERQNSAREKIDERTTGIYDEQADDDELELSDDGETEENDQ